MDLKGAELVTVSNIAIKCNKLKYIRSKDQKMSHHGILSKRLQILKMECSSVSSDQLQTDL